MGKPPNYTTKHSETLQKLKLNGLTLSCAKCLFDQSQVEFFGYVLSAKGISPDLAKAQALKKAERPSNAEEGQSFLGMANYSTRFCKNFSTLAAPLRERTRSKVEWRWAERERAGEGKKDRERETGIRSWEWLTIQQDSARISQH